MSMREYSRGCTNNSKVEPKDQENNLRLELGRLESAVAHMRACINQSRMSDARKWHGNIETITQRMYNNLFLHPE